MAAGDRLSSGVVISAFARAMAEAALVADAGNLNAIGAGFPTLRDVVREWREYGPGYLRAMAAGDEAGMEAARDRWTDAQG
jgi:hypothetical protein